MVYTSGLENRRGLYLRGFESHPARQIQKVVMNTIKIRALVKKWREIAVKLDEKQTVMTANVHRLFANELKAALHRTKENSILSARRKLLRNK